MARREYNGGAAATTLQSSITASSLTISLAAGGGTGWPDGSTGKFLIAIDRGAAAEEKILCLSRSGDTLTVANTGDRGADGTSAASHDASATVEHVMGALDLDEPNRHLNDTALDEHTQYMKADGTRHDLTARHTVGTVVPTAAPVATGTTLAEGVATTGARSDHVHTVGTDSVVTASLANSAVTGLKISNGAVSSTKIGSSQVLTDNLGTGAVTTAKVADNAVTFAKLAAPIADSATIATDETRTSVLYGDLATVGPAVTLTLAANQVVEVTVSAVHYLTGGTDDFTFASFAVSGTATQAASDTNAAYKKHTTSQEDLMLSRSSLFTASTAGSYTFTMKYRVTADTGHWYDRRIIVKPVL